MSWEKSQQAIIEQIICSRITKEKHKKLENQNDISIIYEVADASYKHNEAPHRAESYSREYVRD